MRESWQVLYSILQISIRVLFNPSSGVCVFPGRLRIKTFVIALKASEIFASLFTNLAESPVSH